MVKLQIMLQKIIKKNIKLNDLEALVGREATTKRNVQNMMI